MNRENNGLQAARVDQLGESTASEVLSPLPTMRINNHYRVLSITAGCAVSVFEVVPHARRSASGRVAVEVREPRVHPRHAFRAASFEARAVGVCPEVHAHLVPEQKGD